MIHKTCAIIVIKLFRHKIGKLPLLKKKDQDINRSATGRKGKYLTKQDFSAKDKYKISIPFCHILISINFAFMNVFVRTLAGSVVVVETTIFPF